MLDLDAIRERCEKATPGPWAHVPLRDGGLQLVEADFADVITPEPVSCMAYCYGGTSQYTLTEEDAEFIAHARTDIPELLRYIYLLEKVIGDMNDEF